MKVAIYAAEPYPGGEVTYIKSLIKALSLVQDLTLILYVTPESFQYFNDVRDLTSIKYTRNFKLRFGITLKDKWQRRFLKLVLSLFGDKSLTNIITINNKNIDVFIFPYFAIEATIVNIPYILIPHDKRAFEHENYFRRRLNKAIILKANLIVAESNYVKNDILKFFPINDQKVKIVVSPQPECKMEIGSENIKKVINSYKLPQRFLLFPAHVIPLKNHANLILALAKIKEDRACNVNLVCTYPSKNLSYFSRIKDLIANLKLDNIIFLERISYDELIGMYKLATALVMPTLFESVSIPIWEAFYLGCPVVSSNVCALPEQVSDAGLLFDPNNVEDMAEKIYRIWTDESLRRELIQKGYERVKDLTLENYATQWEKVIDEALKK